MQVENRYSENIEKRRKEEVALLQGRGCFWKKCAFCDYYLDTDSKEQIIKLNKEVLDKINGRFGRLTIINSGSYFELPKETQEEIKKILLDKNISDLSIEAHWLYKDKILNLKEELKNLGVDLHTRIGIETFNEDYRENTLIKGMGNPSVEDIKRYFDECCLLYGIKGQTKEDLLKDIEIATNNFKDVYLNIYEERTDLKADNELIKDFIENIYPNIKDIENLHILIENTDLGVG